jgi:hypothetical protein
MRAKRVDQMLARRRNLFAVFHHLHFERAQPIGIGGLFFGQEAVALAHRGVIAIEMAGMQRIKGKGQPIHKAASLARAINKQAIHGRRQPQDRHPFPQRSSRRGRPVNADEPPLWCIGKRSRPKRRFANMSGNPKSASSRFAGHVGKRGTAQTPPWCQERNSL